MNGKSIGIIELTSVAAGFAVADAMLKAANVGIVLSRSICSGKARPNSWRASSAECDTANQPARSLISGDICRM